MPKKEVIVLDEVPFNPVEWGRSKVLVGPTANGAEHVRVGVTEYNLETPHEPHSHPGQEEVIWVLSGKGYTETHGEKKTYIQGRLLTFPPGWSTRLQPLAGR